MRGSLANTTPLAHSPETSTPSVTDTYCWRPKAVAAIVNHCRESSELASLGDAVIALATTGLGISELASLRITDVDRVSKMIRITDETTRRRSEGTARRETKNSRSRSFPISWELQTVLLTAVFEGRTALPRAAGRAHQTGYDSEHPDTGRVGAAFRAVSVSARRSRF
jgi:integrase